MRHLYGRIAIVMLVAVLASAQLACAEPHEPTFSLSRFAPERVQEQLRYEATLKSSVSTESLRAFHTKLASEPHIAGSEGDARVIEFIAAHFAECGLDVEMQWIWPYLSHPIDAALEIVSPERITLSVSEPPVEGDRYSTDPRLPIGFNAYSGSGEVVGEIVYANFGRKEDFERLSELGVSVQGKIVIARYGGNYRGFKAKYAQEAGAVGLIMYTDPADSGFMRGLMYPEGGWANDQQIQRGSIATLAWPGDPLTPMRPATKDAERLDPESVALPRIPVQPIGWAAAQEIMNRMTGALAPEGWQGAMPFAYRVTGGDDLRVRLMVQQERAITKTANVIGTLRGARYPDEWIIIGCHHDAWGFGASDPMAGMMLVLEAAKRFGEQARAGDRPDRSILFAAWGAEEYGIIGSVEWVEERREELLKNAIVYINLDMAAMGPLLNASGTPALRRLILDAARQVPQARDPEITAYDQWIARTPRSPGGEPPEGPRVGSMGGGSDHIGFYFHIGVPTMSLSASGGRGVSYHSNYDNLHWYHKIVGDDYEPALMLTRVVHVLAARIANADALPFDPTGYAPDLRNHLNAIARLANDKAVSLSLENLRAAVDELEIVAADFNEAVGNAIAAGTVDADARADLNHVLSTLESAWLDEAGLPGRPWFKSLYMAPDETSGYSAWPLPGLRKAIEEQNSTAAEASAAAIEARVRAIISSLSAFKR